MQKIRFQVDKKGILELHGRNYHVISGKDTRLFQMLAYFINEARFLFKSLICSIISRNCYYF